MTCGQGKCTPDAKRVWCTNCQHEHISTIPAFTWACRLCGFGAWHLETALNHTASLPWHETYLVAHPVIPLTNASTANGARA